MNKSKYSKKYSPAVDMTADTAAADIAIGWLDGVIRNRTGDLNTLEVDVSPAFLEAVTANLKRLRDDIAATFDFDNEYH